MDKDTIVAKLEEMGTLLELTGANPFKARAFHNAARAMEGVTDDPAGLVENGGLLDVPGIGKSIADIITEFVRTGRSSEHEKLRSSVPDGLVRMLGIPGMGPKKIKLLHESLHISTLEELEQAAREHRLADVKGFGEKTEQNILKGIAALRTRGDKSLYPKARDAARRVFDVMMKQKGVIRGEIAGSLRRRKEVIGDIDILISAPDNQRGKLMAVFVGHPDVQSVVARGDTKSSVLLNSGINCDLRIVADGEFPFALNYFTGSKEHNVAMRSRAKEYGWSLNEYGFSEIGATEKRGKAKRIVRCKDEADLYKALELSYVLPELREDTGEIAAAASGALPDLVTDADIRGTFHCHTTYSDGVNSIGEMADAARKLGWHYLGIADHSKSAAYAGGLSEEKVRDQLKEIDALNGKMKGFRIFRGTECDILVNGDLDWSDTVLASFDYVVASIHSGFNLSGTEMTQRIIRALKNRYVTMLGHPTGRILLGRDGYPVDMVQVINAAADYGKMIEINAHPSRLDLDWRLVKYAKEKRVLVPINPDAHAIAGLQDVTFGVGIARKGWLGPPDVLNTRSAADVAKLFEGMRT